MDGGQLLVAATQHRDGGVWDIDAIQSMVFMSYRLVP